MKVRFDLRPPEYKERERRTFSPVRAGVVFLLFVFLASSGAYVGLALTEMRFLLSGIGERQNEVTGLEAQRNALDGELAELRKREARFKKALEDARSEPPVLEVLAALEDCTGPGVRINSVRIAPSGSKYAAAVEAVSVSEEQIIAMTEGLAVSDIFDSVIMPSSRKDERTGRINFTLILNLRPLF